MKKIHTLWTPEQVAALNRYQEQGQFHPYTCGGAECREVLYATEDGWKCPKCPYTQTWAMESSVTIGEELA
jgi:hypothetical protein